jgi:hypothetical protein
MGTFSATLTLTAGSSANVGGFNIVGNPGSVSIATGVSRATLAGGVTYNNIVDTVTEFVITSTGDCTNSVTKEVSPTPTITPVPTLEPTTPPQTYSCKESESAPCIEQASPCGSGQIQCGEFLAPN